MEGECLAKRVCVFVDGENFRYSILGLFPQFPASEYLPKQADWEKLFDHIVATSVGSEAERLRTYWYVIELLDMFPWRFPSVQNETKELKELLARNMDKFSEKSASLEPEKLKEEMKRIVDTLLTGQETMRRRFNGWRQVQEGIAFKHRGIEFRRAGAITFNTFDNSLGKEKAVDVKLAMDLVMLREIYDVAVLVAGDQDYVPAVQMIKDLGKTVINIVFRTQTGALLPGASRRLNILTDHCVKMSHSTLAHYLNI